MALNAVAFDQSARPSPKTIRPIRAQYRLCFVVLHTSSLDGIDNSSMSQLVI